MLNSSVIPLTELQLESGKFPVLGAGLWGSVLDVGDGTILKLARPRCAGIGDGREKIEREVSVLQAIAANCDRPRLAVAQVRGWGDRNPSTVTPGDERTVWLHTTRIPGEVMEIEELEALSNAQIQLIGESIAIAMLETHALLRNAKLESVLPGPRETLQLIETEIQGEPDAGVYIDKLFKALEAVGDSAMQVIHGDFNISNLLFDGTSVCSVVDFAETRRGFVEEDLAALVAELPSYRSALVDGYQKLTGQVVAEERLNYGLAKNAFFTFLICRRLGEHDASDEARRNLDRLLDQLLG